MRTLSIMLHVAVLVIVAVIGVAAALRGYHPADMNSIAVSWWHVATVCGVWFLVEVFYTVKAFRRS